MSFQRFFSELKRRRVFRVVGVYAVAAWAAIEVSATVFPLLTLPEWTPTLVVVLALLGFPVTVALAWAFDLTPEGVVRTPPPEAAPEPVPAVPRRPFQLSARATGFFGLGILVALASFAAYSIYAPATAPRPDAPIESIAVLPFDDMSPAGDQEYFSDGITEELLNRLARIENLRVPARTSSFAFKGVNEDVSVIGQKLRVQAVLEGSVRRDGDQVRVTAQLIDTRTGYHLWSQTYDRELASIFAIQDEISNAIVDALQVRLAAASEPSEAGTANVRAHDFYLLGLSRWNDRTGPSLRQAIALFDSAIALDPDYALAHAGRAQAWAVLPSVSDVPFGEAVAAGSAAAARALAIDPELAAAHAAIGQIAQNFEWEVEDAERAYRRAISFDDGYAPAHQWYAEALLLLGRLDEARESIGTALDLDLLSPAALNVSAYLHLVAGRADSALTAFRGLTALHPEYTLAQLNLVLAAIAAGEPPLAIVAIPLATADSATASAMIAVVRGLVEPAARPLALAAARRLDGRLPPALAALWFAALSEHAEALDRLERAVREHVDANVPLILVHPLLRPLHGNPRFDRVLADVGVVISSSGR